jgi:hypothetical protein
MKAILKDFTEEEKKAFIEKIRAEKLKRENNKDKEILK